MTSRKITIMFMAYHLISIGISAYSNPANNLSFSGDEAGELSSILRHSLGNDLTYDVLLRDSEATQIGIRSALKDEALKTASSSDTLILYYSGHGALGAVNGGFEAYLAPYDVNDNILVSGISTSEIKDSLDNLNHGNKIILLDCCYSGGASAKSVTHIKHKDLTHIKAFQNQSYAEGTFVFTACKEDETAIEVPDLKHSLFTYQLIDELLKGKANTIALSSLHDPVTKAVEETALKYSHKQTPTIQMNSKGSMSLPKLTRPPALKPELIKVPSVQDAKPVTVSTPNIDISDKKMKELIQGTLSLVEDATKTKMGQIAFRSMLSKVFASVKDAHAALPKNIRTTDELAGLVTTLEAKSLQLMITTAAVVIMGNDQTLKIFNEEAAQVLLWKHGHSGSVAAIETSDVVFLTLLYIVSTCSIYIDDYSAMGKLLNTHIYDPNRGRTGVYDKVSQHYEVHYADALDGNARTTIQHVVNFLTSQEWLLELLGVDSKKMTALITQANLCLCVVMSKDGERTYPGYNDFDLSNVAPIINRIRSDASTQAGIAKHLFNVTPNEVPKIFADEVVKLNQDSTNRWYQRIRPEAFIEDTTTFED